MTPKHLHAPLAALVLSACPGCFPTGASTSASSGETAATQAKAATPTPVFDGDCSTIRDQYKAQSRHPKESWEPWAKAFAGCDRHDAIFEDLAHWGDMGSTGEGARGLVALERSGMPIREAFEHYLATHKGEAFLSISPELVDYAASHIGHWLLEKDASSFCAPLAASVDPKKASHVGAFLFFFERAGCKAEVEKLAPVLFVSPSSPHRLAICRAVGKLGLKSLEKKTSILATTDESYEIRARCRDALGKLQLRE